MKIVTWNCHGAYRTKSDKIASYKPDIAIIQECECPEKLLFGDGAVQPTTNKWFGNLINTRLPGMSIMSYTGLEFSVHDSYDPGIKYCIPLRVTGHTKLNIIAVLGDVDDVYNAVKVYRRFITSCETIIIGDFNSNPSFSRTGKHMEVVNTLREMNIVSVYHERNKKEHGEEIQPTYYQYYHEDKPSHLDYCFLPKHLADKVTHFEIGNYDTWIKTKLSDHSPIFMELEL